MAAAFSSLHAQEKIPDANLKISATPFYYQQRFSWSIAGNLQGQNPNIYSELIWKNVQRTGIMVDLNLNFQKRFILQTGFLAGVTIAGKAADTDYQNDNRINPVFHANMSSNKGSMYCVSAMLGYKLFETAIWSLTPYVGYGLQRELLYLSGEQGLNSFYSPTWYGPRLALEQSFNLNKNASIKIACGYHQLKYTAQADWNLIEEFKHPVSFKHIAYGYRIEAGAEFSLAVHHSFQFLLKGNYFYSSTGRGIDELYYQSGDIVKTQLNDATLNGFLAGIGIRWLL
jgi:hypothetical protein